MTDFRQSLLNRMKDIYENDDEIIQEFSDACELYKDEEFSLIWDKSLEALVKKHEEKQKNT